MDYFEKETTAILKTEDPTARFERFLNLLYIYIDGQHADTVITLLKRFIEEAENHPETGYAGVYYCSLGYIYLSTGRTADFEICWEKAQQKFPEIKTIKGLSIFWVYQSIVSWFQGKRNDGFDALFNGIKVLEGSDNLLNLGWAYFTLATYQFDSNQLAEAEENYVKSINYFLSCNSDYGYARSSNGLASIKIKHEKYEEAEKILYEIREIYRRYQKYSGLSRVLTDLGIIAARHGRHEEALELHRQAYDMRLDSYNLQGQITSLLEMGHSLIALKKFDEASNNLEAAALLSSKNNFKAKAFRAYEMLAAMAKLQGRHQQANEYLETYFSYKMQVLADESTGRIKLLQTQLLAEEASKRAAIEAEANTELRRAYKIIEQKNTEILQSIDYARRIQKTILPNPGAIKKYLPSSFIYYKPKDIVAGDFYWLHTMGGRIYFAVCDCTGHGVPGAFVSLVCHQALNRAVTEFSCITPAQILDKTNEIVINSFTGNDNEYLNDGMDASMIMIDTKQQSMVWAGANNPLFVVRNGTPNPALEVIKPDKQPIGKFDRVHPFTDQHLTLKSGDKIYLFTDGFADQFGGPAQGSGGKKFSMKRFRETVLSLYHMKMENQESALDITLKNWKNEMEQIDDMLVAGIEVNFW